MTAEKIRLLLESNTKWDSEEDRLYWVRRLAELEQKERTAKENEKYFRKNRVYDR